MYILLVATDSEEAVELEIYLQQIKKEFSPRLDAEK